MPVDTLTRAITAQPPPIRLPSALPIAHVGNAQYFSKIVADGQLQARPCSVFRRDILYFFYGGCFYHPSNGITRCQNKLPVAFLYRPIVLNRASRHFPFDTGAVDSDRIGQHWSRVMKPYKRRFGVHSHGDYNRPALLVHHLFGSNEEYLNNNPQQSCLQLDEPFPTLYNFMKADLTSFGIDQRQHVIECHFQEDIPLDDKLLWVGFPRELTNVFLDLLDSIQPHVPQSYAYKYPINSNPHQIAYDLQQKAMDEINRYVNPGATNP